MTDNAEGLNVIQAETLKPGGEPAGFWQRLRCALFHHKAKTWLSLDHSWAFHCGKCGLTGEVYD